MKNWDNLTPQQIEGLVKHEAKRKGIIKQVEADWKDKPKKKKK